MWTETMFLGGLTCFTQTVVASVMGPFSRSEGQMHFRE